MDFFGHVGFVLLAPRLGDSVSDGIFSTRPMAAVVLQVMPRFCRINSHLALENFTFDDVII